MQIVASDSNPVPTGSGTQNWQQAVRAAVRDVDELARCLGLDPRWAEQARQAAAEFPLFVPRDYLNRIEPRNPADPLLRQVMPLASETAERPGFGADPVGDLRAQPLPGLLRKYTGRALLVLSSVCPIHCRYCFRRHFPYELAPRGLNAWEPALAEIQADGSLEEVILSGGDPLMLVDSLLQRLVDRLARIPHLQRLRVHSRMPIVIPSRVTDAMLAWLVGSRLQPIMVVHSNHVRELDGPVARSLRRLITAGVPVLNQAVLLRGVNDRLEALQTLNQRLVNLGVLPYYLHQLDRVAGAAHFEVPEDEGRRLVEGLRETLPGYAVPRYVREIAGEPAKTPL